MTSHLSFCSQNQSGEEENASDVFAADSSTAHEVDSEQTDEVRERRGFALYVGMSESKARENGVELSEVVDALRNELTGRVPLAETHALAVIAPIDASPRDLEVVMRATGERVAERSEPIPARDETAEVGVVIDLARHRVLVEDRDVHLTFKEFALLQALARSGGKTLNRRQLREVIATDEEMDVHDRTIDVHIRRLRVKFGAYPDLIRTVHGRGYRFDPRRDVAVLGSPPPSPHLL
jgi:DNA-binding winged helix-turn-helix (wHTH) protein